MKLELLIFHFLGLLEQCLAQLIRCNRNRTKGHFSIKVSYEMKKYGVR